MENPAIILARMKEANTPTMAAAMTLSIGRQNKTLSFDRWRQVLPFYQYW